MADHLPTLFYATPTGKHPHPGYVTSMRDLEMSCQTFERRPHDFMFACGPVQMARSEIGERACRGTCREKHMHTCHERCRLEHQHNRVPCKDTPYDFVLMHDDDLMVNGGGPHGNPIDAWHAIFDARPDVAVIGAVYLRERMNTPTIVMPHPQYPEENCHLVYGMPAGPFEVSGIGTGFMLIRVSALRQLRDLEDGEHSLFRFPFTRTRWGGYNHTGEDYDFCARIRRLGYKVLVDPRFETGHIKESGTMHFHRDSYESQWADPPAEWSEAQRKAHAASIVARTEALMEAVVTGIVPITIGGMTCLDHVPLLIAEANAKAAKAAREAPAVIAPTTPASASARPTLTDDVYSAPTAQEVAA